jgi:hypothetical protein
VLDGFVDDHVHGANAGSASYAQKDHALVRSSSFKENKTHTK